MTWKDRASIELNQIKFQRVWFVQIKQGDLEVWFVWTLYDFNSIHNLSNFYHVTAVNICYMVKIFSTRAAACRCPGTREEKKRMTWWLLSESWSKYERMLFWTRKKYLQMIMMRIELMYHQVNVTCLINSRSTSSHLYAVTGTSNQLYISWWNQDELQGIKRAQKPSFAVSFDPVQRRDYAARSTSQQTFNSRSPNWTTVDQALGRSRAIYIGKNWAQKPGFFFAFLPELLLPSDSTATDATTRRSRSSTSLQFLTPKSFIQMTKP